ncbi:MAG TPA: MBL fold metallo-hydrolase [Vicinamibacterales bacterium]|jgi:glyoxylase-like metal-dependent hydrolase (beta-lactamase superfamily II)|nr:MBL fold metallo-hydrolase [Vicinamibacterales bacterium]
MKRLVVLAFVLAGGGAGIALSQQPAQPQEIEVDKVKDNLFVLRNGGGNTAVFITEKGVVLVDTKNPGWGPRILDKVKTLTEKPVTMIINTHTHGDHVGSNEAFSPTVEFVAHENTKANMEKMPAFAGDKQAFLPKRTYTDRLSLLGGNDRVELYYFGRGHTNGDTFIVFPFHRTVHTGDLFAARATPLIDMNNGGSGVEYPQTLAKAVAGIKDVETVIPGHSPVTDWKTFQEFAEFNKEFLTAVEAAKKAGKTADEAAAGLALGDRWKDYGMTRTKDNITKIYSELK